MTARWDDRLEGFTAPRHQRPRHRRPRHRWAARNLLARLMGWVARQRPALRDFTEDFAAQTAILIAAVVVVLCVAFLVRGAL